MIRGILAVLLACLACACTDSELVYHDMNGKEVRFGDLRGHWVAINYWAIWCEPCRKEIPELNRLAKKENGRITLLGVNFDLPQGEPLRRQATALGIEFKVLVEDPSEQLGYERPDVLPATYLVGPDGQFVRALIGPQTASSVLAAIDSH